MHERYTDQNLFKNHRGDAKSIYKLSNQLLFRKEPLPLPSCEDERKLVEKFNNFFVVKIAKIMDGLKPEKPDDINTKFLETTFEINTRFEQFDVLQDGDIEKILIKLANKSELDPVPTSIIKNHTDIFIPLLKTIINTSLQQGIFPQILRSGIVRPLLKTLVETNYRPVSNLQSLLKKLHVTKSLNVLHQLEG